MFKLVQGVEINCNEDGTRSIARCNFFDNNTVIISNSVSYNNNKQSLQHKGMAIILALFLVTIVAALSIYLIHKQDILIIKVKQQKVLQNLDGLSWGALFWAKIAIASDSNDVDFRAENVWKTKHLNISSLLKEQNILDAKDDSIYLSAYMEDANSKFNIYNLINWQNIEAAQSAFKDPQTGLISTSQSIPKRIPMRLNAPYFIAYQNLLKSLNISPDLAWQTVYYIFMNYNRSLPKMTSADLKYMGIEGMQIASSIQNTQNVTLQQLGDLSYIGYSLDDIQKIKPYIIFIHADTKINANTASSLLIKAFAPKALEVDFFEKNVQTYANNISDVITYLGIDANDIQTINVAQNCLDVKSQYMDIYAKIEQGKYIKPVFARMDKISKQIIEYSEGQQAAHLYQDSMLE
jgi:type II secretory pathway component PulK